MSDALSFDPVQIAQDAAEGQDRPVIQVEPGARHTMADKALAAIVWRGGVLPA